MTNKKLSAFRKDYRLGELTESAVPDDPMVLFHGWLEEAIRQDLPEPNAMTLATATPTGIPSARIVLLKGISNRQFIFFTNYQSQKSRELEINPMASLVFLWLEMQRQVRISGRVEKIPASDSDLYFKSRPLESQIGAWASPQSQKMADRQELEMAYEHFATKQHSQPLERPPHWGGYGLTPSSIEFWQGRTGRMHDRLLFEKQGNQWALSRLAP